MNIPVDHLSRDDLKKLANQFLDENNPKKVIPVPIDLVIEENLNIDIVPSVGLKNILGNDGFIAKDFSTIHVDYNVYMNTRGIKKKGYFFLLIVSEMAMSTLSTLFL